MPSIFETIMGGGDQTPDPAGLTNADRSQIGFSGLGQLGALLLAAGQPMWGNERARYLAGLGTIPGNMQEQRSQILQQKRQGQQLEAERRANAAAKSVQDLANDPNAMSGLSPHMQTIMRAAYATGNPQQVLAVQKEARESGQPVPLGGGMFWDRATNTAINPLTGIRFKLGPDGMPLADGATYNNGVPVAPGDMDIDPTTGYREAWLNKAVPEQYRDRVRKIAQGDQKMPSSGSRDPLSQSLQGWVAQYAPDYKEQDFAAKQKMLNEVSAGGTLFKNVIAPAQKLMNHSAHLLKVVDAIGAEDGDGDMGTGLLAQVSNQMRYYKSKAAGDGKAEALDTSRKAVLDEFTKFMRGTGGMTDQAERLQEKLSGASTPSQYKAVLTQIVELMHGQLDPVARQYALAMKKPSATPIDLLGHGDDAASARRNLELVQNWEPASKRKAAGEAPAQSAADKPPVEGARKAPDGKWYVEKNGKYFEVR